MLQWKTAAPAAAAVLQQYGVHFNRERERESVYCDRSVQKMIYVHQPPSSYYRNTEYSEYVRS